MEYMLWRWKLKIRTIGRRIGLRLWRHPKVQPWNWDKPHRCPVCHTIAVWQGRPSWKHVYRCCHCKALFARWPGLVAHREPTDCDYWEG